MTVDPRPRFPVVRFLLVPRSPLPLYFRVIRAGPSEDGGRSFDRERLIELSFIRRRYFSKIARRQAASQPANRPANQLFPPRYLPATAELCSQEHENLKSAIYVLGQRSRK